MRGHPQAAEERLSQFLETLDSPHDRARTAIALADIAYLQAQPLKIRDILDRLSSAPVEGSFRAALSARRLIATLLIDGPRRVLAEPLPPYDETRDDAAFPISVCRAQAYLRMGRTASAQRELDKLDAVIATAPRVGLWRFPGIYGLSHCWHKGVAILWLWEGCGLRCLANALRVAKILKKEVVFLVLK